MSKIEQHHNDLLDKELDKFDESQRDLEKLNESVESELNYLRDDLTTELIESIEDKLSETQKEFFDKYINIKIEWENKYE